MPAAPPPHSHSPTHHADSCEISRVQDRLVLSGSVYPVHDAGKGAAHRRGDGQVSRRAGDLGPYCVQLREGQDVLAALTGDAEPEGVRPEFLPQGALRGVLARAEGICRLCKSEWVGE